jgi:hypothetical protein
MIWFQEIFCMKATNILDEFSMEMIAILIVVNFLEDS